jgi:hypothetical protein
MDGDGHPSPERIRAGLGHPIITPERNTRDRATGLPPRLLYEGLEEPGIDFAVLYSTAGLRVSRIADDTPRRAACRAFNVLTMDHFRDFGDRMTPAAVIPVHTPEEAKAAAALLAETPSGVGR